VARGEQAQMKGGATGGEEEGVWGTQAAEGCAGDCTEAPVGPMALTDLIGEDIQPVGRLHFQEGEEALRVKGVGLEVQGGEEAPVEAREAVHVGRGCRPLGRK